MMNMLVGVLVEVIKTVSEIEREQHLGFGLFGFWWWFGFTYFWKEFSPPKTWGNDPIGRIFHIFQMGGEKPPSSFALVYFFGCGGNRGEGQVIEWMILWE